MSELSPSQLTDSRTLVNQTSGLTAGAQIRQAREAQGLHIAALSVTLKVSIKKLEALEADRLDLLTDTVFVRALASSVCRALKINAMPILDALPHSCAPQMKSDAEGLNTPFKNSGKGLGSSLMSQLSNPLTIGVLLALLGVIATVLIPAGTTSKNDADSVRLSVNVVTPTVSSNASSMPEISRTLGSETQAESTPAYAASEPTTDVSAANGLVESKLTSGVLTLQAKGVTWVEVTDAHHVLQLRKTMGIGELIHVSGALPMSVVLGRADQVIVKVREMSLDLTSVVKDNVARFEVN
jgi:cytoskeleton protein RodZ